MAGNLPPLVYADRLVREMAAFALAAGTATEDGELTLARVFENAELNAPRTPADVTVVCSWCPPRGRRTVLHDAGPGAPVSHGICPACAREFVEEEHGGPRGPESSVAVNMAPMNAEVSHG